MHINFLVLESEMAANPPFPPFDTLRTGFDTLRANGAGAEGVPECPFVLNPSTGYYVDVKPTNTRVLRFSYASSPSRPQRDLLLCVARHTAVTLSWHVPLTRADVALNLEKAVYEGKFDPQVLSPFAPQPLRVLESIPEDIAKSSGIVKPEQREVPRVPSCNAPWWKQLAYRDMVNR